MKKLVNLKKGYYNYLDGSARHLARKLEEKKPVTRLLLGYIGDLYNSAKLEKEFENENFESAYHNPITSELEFLIARIIYHYSQRKKLGWKIYLRRQKAKTAPDIRIDKDGKTLALIELKARVGWMQQVFSKERLGVYKKQYKQNGGIDPSDSIKVFKDQIKKHCVAHKVKKDQFFVLVPSISGAHRKKSGRKLEDYKKDFTKNSGLSEENFILLSGNIKFDAGGNWKRGEYEATNKFEQMIKKIEKIK